MLIWAGAGIAVKEALLVFAPLTLIVVRFTLAVLLMLVVGLVCRKSEVLGLQKMEKGDWSLFVLGGLFQPFLYFIFETYTYQIFSSPTIAEAFLSTQPVLAPLVAWLLLRERVTRNNIVGIGISTVGMLVLLLVGSGSYGVGSCLGVLLALVTVSMSVGYSVVLRRIPSRYSPLSIVFYVQGVALVLFYVLWGGACLMTSFEPLVDVMEWAPCQLQRAGLSVVYLAVLASVMAFVLFCYTVRKIGVTRANVFNNIRPVFTAMLMMLLLGEVLPLWKWVGIVLIIIGLFISQKRIKE